MNIAPAPVVAVSVGEAVLEAGRRLSLAGVDTARLDARVLLCHVLECDPSYLLAHSEAPLGDEQENLFNRLLERRVRREPVAYILGRREFWELDFMVNRNTLVPRPDSETLIEAALERLSDRNADIKILDLGTGSGCLLLSLLHEFPNAYGIGVDVSVSALSLARANARALGMDGRAGFFGGNWGAAVKGHFDLVIANPPYIADADVGGLEPEVAVFEPEGALFGGADGLECYRAIVPYLPGLTSPGGMVILETGFGQAMVVAGMIRKAGMQVIDIKHDLSGVERCVVALPGD